MSVVKNFSALFCVCAAAAPWGVGAAVPAAQAADGTSLNDTAAGELPDELRFSRHIVPLLSRLGCNSGSCHGTVQGQNGFRLSLFGAEPEMDHQRLLREHSGRRLNLVSPDESLLLLKATAAVAHEGGKRLSTGSREYRLLRSWIAQGAPLDDVAASRVERLTVTPAEHTAKPGESFSLRVEALFADGTREDMTAFSSFEVNDEDIATVDAGGTVRATGIGDMAVVVRYPGEVGFSTLLVVPQDRPKIGGRPAAAQAKPHNFIDRHVLARLAQLNIEPAELCDDVTFLRRATLDVAGTLPTPEEVRAFQADKSSGKRAKKIDELLERNGHAALWATRFGDILRLTGFDAELFPPKVDEEFRAYEWVRARLLENTPYDEFVERIVLASSREGRSYEKWFDEIADVAIEEVRGESPRTYAARQTLDLYWQRRATEEVEPAIRFAHGFLGLRLQCAQCHRHPTDVWTQDDLLSLANCFMRVPKYSIRATRGRKLERNEPELDKLVNRSIEEAIKRYKLDEKEGKSFESAFKRMVDREVEAVDRGLASVTSPLGTQSSAELRLLGGEQPLPAFADGEDPRPAVMQWLRRPDNRFFAAAIVNRIWAHYFERGIVDPPDDLSPLNPPSHPQLLDELCRGFIENHYDLKWLHRTILNSRTYQQSSALSEGNRKDRRNFASFYLRRIPAEVMLDALDQATGSTTTFRFGRGSVKMDLPEGTRHLGGGSLLARGTGGFALDIFGRPPRELEEFCDCEREDEPTMLQALYLANHPEVRAKIAKGRVVRIAKEFSDNAQRVEEVYLWTVCRLPTEAEQQACLKFLEESESAQEALESIQWGLINSDEFIFNY